MGNVAIKKEPYRWTVIGFIFLFYFVVLGFTNQAFNVLLATMAKDLQWNGVQTTAIATAMFSGMIWFVFVAGAILDKFSAKKVMAATGVLVAVVFFLRGYAQDFTFFFVIMFIYGIASAFYIPTCIKLISLWFDTSEIALANGMLTSASPLGQLVANLFGYNIAMAIGGWRALYMVLGVATIVIIAFFFFVLRERKSEDAALESAVLKHEDLTFWRNIGGVAKTPLVWLYAIANAGFLGCVYGLMAYQNYLLQMDPGWHLTAATSGTVPAFSNMVSMFAYTLVPFIIMKLNAQKHYPLIAIISGIIATTALIIGYASYSYGLICAMMAVSGLFFGAALPAPKVFMLQLPEVSGPRAGTAMGLYVTIERIGVTVLVAIVGGLITSGKPAIGMTYVFSSAITMMYISPILIFVGWMITRHMSKKKKLASANLENAVSPNEPTIE